jgi:hypothetical protein
MQIAVYAERKFPDAFSDETQFDNAVDRPVPSQAVHPESMSRYVASISRHHTKKRFIGGL